MMKKAVRVFLAFVSFFLIGGRFYGMGSKEYAMIYFKFGPEDLKIRVFPDNKDLTDETHTDYVIKRIEKSRCKLYLVRKFANERELVDYRYRILFYKPQKIGNRSYDIPIYSFKVSFSGEDVVVEYPPLKAVPSEIKKNAFKKHFQKASDSGVYFIKDYTGGDFALYDQMRKVKFMGKIKHEDGSESDVPDSLHLQVCLTKIAEENTNQVEREREKEINSICVPLNREITLGMVPYALSSKEGERYQLKFLKIGDEESEVKIIHFAEVWNNLYEQTLIYQDNGYYLDFNFDDRIYDLEYSGDSQENERAKRATKSPHTIFLKDLDGKNFRIKLVPKSYVSRYLDLSPLVQFQIDASQKARVLAEKLVQDYPNALILKKKALWVLPRYKKTPFSIFTEPEGARIRIKRIEPPEDKGFKIIGPSPVFFDQFEYGRYQIAADWFEKGSYDLEVRSVTREMTVEFSDSPESELTDAIQWIQKGDIRIPFVTLKYRAKDFHPVKKTKKKQKKQEKAPEKFKQKNNSDIGVHSILKGPSVLYYVQIAAFERNDKSKKLIRDFIRKKVNVNHFNRVFDRDEVWGAVKRVKGRDFIVLVVGAFSRSEAKSARKELLRWFPGSFVLSDREIDPIEGAKK